MRAEAISIKAKDGADINAVMHGLEAGDAKGIIIVIHGFGEHAGRYEEFAEYMKNGGYASLVFDQRGHGHLSEPSLEKRRKLQGIIPSYQSFLDDIETVTDYMKRRADNLPFVLYGHSMGGNIAVNYLLKHGQSEFSCAVLEAPWLGLYKEVSWPEVFAAKVLGRISPKIAITRGIPANDVVDDESRSKELTQDPLYHNRISFRLFSGCKEGCDYVAGNASRITLPIYLAMAKNERVVSNEAIERFFKACGSGEAIKKGEYESNHSIHSGESREAFCRDVIDFLDMHCH